MSNTDVILVTIVDDGDYLIEEPRNIDKLNEYLLEVYGKKLEPVQGYAGGDNSMLCDVFIGGFDQFDARKFYMQFLDIGWEEPDYAQLMIKGEHETKFTTYFPIGSGPLQS